MNRAAKAKNQRKLNIRAVKRAEAEGQTIPNDQILMTKSETNLKFKRPNVRNGQWQTFLPSRSLALPVAFATLPANLLPAPTYVCETQGVT